MAPVTFSLTDAINFAYQELERKKQAALAPPEVIDLTLEDDEEDEQAAIAQDAPAPSSSSATKEEAISPPVSTVHKPEDPSECLVTYMCCSR